MEYGAHRHTGELDESGYSIAPGVLDSAAIASLLTAIAHVPGSGASAGVRGLAAKSPAILELANSPTIRALVEPIAGVGTRLIRSILFIKDEETNWSVSWHQDLAIAVRKKVEIEGYTGWSTKEGVVHVQPPIEVLASILTLRLHLDQTDDTNGALIVAPRSHLVGRIPAAEAADVAKRLGSHVCSVQAGDALLLRPLILHASSKATTSRPRRIIHFEFTSMNLPEPLDWNE